MDRTSKNATQDDDMEFFVKHQDIPEEQVRSILRHRKMSDDKVEAMIQKIRDAQERIRKHARRFIEKIDQHYGLHDVPTIVSKANKFAQKHQLSTLERDTIISMALKGDVYNTSNPINDLKYSEMSKFMGMESPVGQVLNIQSKDYAPLNEIVKLFESARILHSDVKNQLNLYKDCAIEAISGTYDKSKHNVSTHIHPVIVALFIPQIPTLERRMLLTNVGRVVLRRALPYINRHVQLYDNLLPGEEEAEWELTSDIVQDPNSLAYFSDDTPITNIMKRFKIQIELWKNVLNLRQGRYYASGYDDNDGITGLLRTLSQYDWNYFDAPDMYHIQDEGTVLRKLLAVFSLRPTLTQVSSLVQRTYMGMSNFTGLSRVTFLKIPIINVRLPTIVQGNAGLPMPDIHLERSKNQTDYFIENKLFVPKTKSVMYSKDVLFFHVNRRYQTVNVANIAHRFSYSSMPYQSFNVGQTRINDLPVGFDPQLSLNRDMFTLRSVVTVYRPPIAENIAAGSSCMIVQQDNASEYLYYNPLLANMMHEKDGVYQQNKPFAFIFANPSGPDEIGFIESAQKFGTIFCYCC
jgi:hypothetical protein